MSSEWPPDEPERRRSRAPSGGSHRRSAVQTPPFGTDLRAGQEGGEPFRREPGPGETPGYGPPTGARPAGGQSWNDSPGYGPPDASARSGPGYGAPARSGPRHGAPAAPGSPAVRGPGYGAPPRSGPRHGAPAG